MLISTLYSDNITAAGKIHVKATTLKKFLKEYNVYMKKIKAEESYLFHTYSTWEVLCP